MNLSWRLATRTVAFAPSSIATTTRPCSSGLSASSASARTRKGAISRRQRSLPCRQRQSPSSRTCRTAFGEKRKHQVLDPSRALNRWTANFAELRHCDQDARQGNERRRRRRRPPAADRCLAQANHDVPPLTPTRRCLPMTDECGRCPGRLERFRRRHSSGRFLAATARLRRGDHGDPLPGSLGRRRRRGRRVRPGQGRLCRCIPRRGFGSAPALRRAGPSRRTWPAPNGRWRRWARPSGSRTAGRLVTA